MLRIEYTVIADYARAEHFVNQTYHAGPANTPGRSVVKGPALYAFIADFNIINDTAFCPFPDVAFRSLPSESPSYTGL